MGEEKRPRGRPRKATFAQQLALVDWLRSNRARLEAERPSLTTAAEQASADLGWTVKPSLVHSLRDSLGMAWQAKRLYTPFSQVKALRLAVLELYRHLGLEVPEGLRREGEG